MTSIAIAEPQTTVQTVAPTALPPEAEPFTIGVSVDFNNNLSVSDNFVRVPDGWSRDITWQLSLEASDDRIIVFDNPPIRILTSPDQAQPTLVPLETGSHSVTFRWFNDNPLLYGTSFAYRVHSVICNGDGTYTPVSSDPIIRNDPPPAQ